MAAAFKAGRFEDGLNAAIDAVDALLVRHFPLAEGRATPTNCPTGPAALSRRRTTGS